jgi:hypothetical protein
MPALVRRRPHVTALPVVPDLCYDTAVMEEVHRRVLQGIEQKRRQLLCLQVLKQLPSRMRQSDAL